MCTPFYMLMEMYKVLNNLNMPGDFMSSCILYIYVCKHMYGHVIGGILVMF